MGDLRKAGKSAVNRFWVLEALTQLIDLRIYHAEDPEIAKAEDALLPGEATLGRAPGA